MGKAIGMVELTTVSCGIGAADTLVKTAEVEVIEAQTVCPGKYIVLVSGELSAVRSAVDAAKTKFSSKVIDSFVLGNPHESIFKAIYGATEVKDVNALGVFETYTAASAIEAADVAAKTAQVELIEIRLARGMCGKSYLLIAGEVSAVEASIEAAKNRVSDNGMFLDSYVIPSPDKKIWDAIL